MSASELIKIDWLMAQCAAMFSGGNRSGHDGMRFPELHPI